MRDVNVDERMQQDIVGDMITAFVEGNRAASKAYYDGEDKANAKLYGQQAVAGEVVREMLKIERKHADGPKRLENLLKKGGINHLAALVMQSNKFKEYTDVMNMGNPEQLDRLIANPISATARVAFEVMRNVQAAQEKAAQNAQNVHNVQPQAGAQLNNAQPQAAQPVAPAPKA